MDTRKEQSVLAFILSKLGANTTLFWLWILEHALSSAFRFIVQLSFISKERGVFLCAVHTGRARSQHRFLFPVDVKYF